MYNIIDINKSMFRSIDIADINGLHFIYNLYLIIINTYVLLYLNIYIQ